MSSISPGEVPAPRTWVDQEFVSAAKLNSDIRDMVNWLNNPPNIDLSMFNNGGGTVVANTQFDVPWAFELRKQDVMHTSDGNPERAICQTPGIYFVTARIEYNAESGIVTGHRDMHININGTTERTGDNGDQPGASTTTRLSCASTAPLNAGDWVNVRLFQTADDANGITISDECQLSLRWLAPLTNTGSVSLATPATWSNGSVTAAQMNSRLRDQMKFLLNVPRIGTARATTQSIPNQTITALSMTSEDYKVGVTHSTSTNPWNNTIVTPGLYLVTAYANFVSNGSGGGQRRLELYKNGDANGVGGTVFASENKPQTFGTATLISACGFSRAVAGDSFQACVYQSSGASLNIAAGSTFTATWIGK